MDKELGKRFYKYQVPDWEAFAASEILTSKEQSFLESIARTIQRGFPTEKQVNWALALVEKIQSTSEKNMSQDRPSHFSLRVAWHDSKWNGQVCKDPAGNTYCNGEYSLLSRRIRTRKDPEIESRLAQAGITRDDSYQVPCYWSINLFGGNETAYLHDNPAAPKVERITESLPAYSAFSWPFKLSFVRDWKDTQAYGKYFPKEILEARIDSFQKSIQPRQSIAFFYANFDNPVSGNDFLYNGEHRRYLVVGCGFVAEKGDKQQFKIEPAYLQQLRSRPDSKNFPELSWNLRYSFDPESMVRLPYHEYLEKNENGDLDQLLDEIKVTIDEAELEQGFKYVAMDLDNDQAIYLLSKILKSLRKVREHGLNLDYPTEKSIERVEAMLTHCWNLRGYLPGFGALARAFSPNVEEFDDQIYTFFDQLRQRYPDDYAAKLLGILQNKIYPKDLGLGDYDRLILILKDDLEDENIAGLDFLRLAMLDLHEKQFRNIMEDDQLCSVAFQNPYALYEEYEPSDIVENVRTGKTIDGAIDLFKIDIAFFPQKKYLLRFKELQNLKEDDIRRLRACTIQYLEERIEYGDCYAGSREIQEYVEGFPLFYHPEDPLRISTDFSNLSKENEAHISQKVHLTRIGDETYFYLKRIFEMERHVKIAVDQLLSSNAKPLPSWDFLGNIERSAAELSSSLGDRFDREGFIAERRQLFDRLSKARLFVLSGAPGSGKSKEVINLIQAFDENNQHYTLLAPTGKAVLRLKSDNATGVRAETIDKFLFGRQGNKIIVRNLIIDEMSMVDLEKFASLLHSIEIEKLERLILVGDQYQLAPIGCGKPFADIISYIEGTEFRDRNYIYLETNCRVKGSNSLVEFAEIFTGQRKGLEHSLPRFVNSETASELGIRLWNHSDDLNNLIAEAMLGRFGNESKDKSALIDDALGFPQESHIKLENFQILSPYRTGNGSVLSVNGLFHREYRAAGYRLNRESEFHAFEKVIQIQNHYDTGRRNLIVANGTLGYTNKTGSLIFPGTDETGPVRVPAETTELAYCITVHKAQGSGFNHVFVILPGKKGLLNRELLYTALTRAIETSAVFVQARNYEEMVAYLKNALRTSAKELRRTSIFTDPFQKFSYEPAKGVTVKSRVEYIIYKKLELFKERYADFDFEYEKVYELPGKTFNIRPDFTLKLPTGEVVFWEHLGKLTSRRYRKDWNDRKQLYEIKNDFDKVITTDELKGISDDRIAMIVDDILAGCGGADRNSGYSQRHYSLA